MALSSLSAIVGCQPPSPPNSSPSSYAIRVQFSAGNIALLLLFFSACFHSLAKYFYSYYKLLFGTLYPCFASFKAIKNKNVKEYVSTFCSEYLTTC